MSLLERSNPVNWWYILYLNFLKQFAVTKFVPLIHSVCLTENKNIVEPEDISMARKIDQTLKVSKLERCSQNGDT